MKKLGLSIIAIGLGMFTWIGLSKLFMIIITFCLALINVVAGEPFDLQSLVYSAEVLTFIFTTLCFFATIATIYHGIKNDFNFNKENNETL